MTPEYVVLELLPPAVNVPVPRVTEPAPESDPTVSSKLFRSSVAPEAMLTAESSAHLSIAPSLRVPSVMVVEPVKLLAPLTTSVPDPSFTKLVPVPVIAPV